MENSKHMRTELLKAVNNDPARDLMYEVTLLYTKYMDIHHMFLADEGLTSTFAHTLKHICQEPGVTMSEMAEYWGKTKGTISAQVSALEEKGLMLMDINLSKPKAASSKQAELEYEPYTADDLNLTMYIHGRDAWDQEKVRFCYIAEDKDEVFSRTMLEDVYYGSQFEGYDASGKYLSIDMKHFSPFVVFNEGEAKTPPTPTPAPPSAAPGIAAPPTGDGAQPVLWASVLLMGLAAIGMMIASSRKAKE